MQVLGIRLCAVSVEAAAIADTLDRLGWPRKDIGEHGSPDSGFAGAVYPAGTSWVEVWPAAEGMPPGIMLQIVVDDADAFAAAARAQGLEPKGPADAHGERIYFLPLPGGLQASFQSALSLNGSAVSGNARAGRLPRRPFSAGGVPAAARRECRA